MDGEAGSPATATLSSYCLNPADSGRKTARKRFLLWENEFSQSKNPPVPAIHAAGDDCCSRGFFRQPEAPFSRWRGAPACHGTKSSSEGSAMAIELGRPGEVKNVAAEQNDGKRKRFCVLQSSSSQDPPNSWMQDQTSRHHARTGQQSRRERKAARSDAAWSVGDGALPSPVETHREWNRRRMGDNTPKPFDQGFARIHGPWAL